MRTFKEINEMKKFFEIRTNLHIERVQKYANMLADKFPEIRYLRKVVETHDQSKFMDPEYVPYLYITWNYKCKKEGVKFDIPEEIKDRMHEATTHHVLSNKHHPEFWSVDKTDVINKNLEDRDKPAKEIFALNMPEVYLAEMVADWSSMSEEHGEKAGPYKWAQENINIRWKFSKTQTEQIYKFIDFLWKDVK